MAAPATREERGKSRSRLLKIECAGCGMILRGSAAALRQGLPTCACGEVFEIPSMASLERVDPDAFEEMTARLSRTQHTALMRTLGYGDQIERRNAGRRIAQPQCSLAGCSKFRAYGVKFCAAHADHELPF